ncbi:hypothetical protein [Brevibacillus brevis]
MQAGHEVIGMTRREEQGQAIEKLGAKLLLQMCLIGSRS